MLAAVALLLITSLGSLVGADEVQCWAPDGTTVADNETVVPCNKLGITQKGVHSSCCRLDGDARQRDLCTTAGLCLSTFDSVLRREYCTDKTWKSPACVNVCTDASNGGSANGTVQMTACSDGTGTYCCGANNLECCGTDRAIVIPTQGSVVSNDDKNSDSTDSSFKGATIGLAVVLGVFALASLGVILWLLKQKKSVEQQLNEKISLLSQHDNHHDHPAQPTPAPTVASPYQGYSAPPTPGYKDSLPPAPSPGYSSGVAPYEMTSHTQRYSELDASAIAPRSEMGSPGPHAHYDGMGSPRHNDGFPR